MSQHWRDGASFFHVIFIEVVFLYKLIDLLLYGNFFIALCAASMVYQIHIINDDFQWFNPGAFLLFFATLFIYSLHRLVSSNILEKTSNNRRLSIILQFQKHLVGYALIGMLGTLIMCTLVPVEFLFLLVIPGAVSILYIAPVFRNKQRFRDLPFVKVFAVGLAWTWACVFIPLKVQHDFLEGNDIRLILEKFLFIAAITIPFDIRDRELDKRQNIKTIPSYLGINKSKVLSITLVVAATCFATINYLLQFYSIALFTGLVISYLVTVLIIFPISERSHDYHYSGLLDGTILLQLILMSIFSLF